MVAWDHKVASNWAKLFGFVPVPLFGRQRDAGVEGQHFVLLDGHRSSLTFSLGDANRLLASRQPSEWAWSANVPRSVIVDERTAVISGFRWDRPSDVREVRIASTDSVKQMLTDLESPVSVSDTSIKRALTIFRSVRQGVLEHGGSDVDATGAFTVLLILADQMRRDVRFPHVRELAPNLDRLRSAERPLAFLRPFSRAILDLPIGDLAEQLLGEQSEHHLEPHLLLRHASGTLFQEAHIQLKKPPVQQGRLFISLHPDMPRPTGEARPDIHYTPTAMARFLAELAVKEFLRLHPGANNVTILDPACGSGVFLVEALRELEGKGISATVRGVDSSEISKVMADFAVSSAVDDFKAAGSSVSVSINVADSLEGAWGRPNIILMNPPFMPWRRIDQKLRSEVRGSLGSLFHGHADTAIAFLAKAARELTTGSVLATVLPVAFLKSASASKVRKFLSGHGWQIVMIGRIRGYGYFPNATIEPAFIVLRKSDEPSNPVRTLISESDVADIAIRAARITPINESLIGNGWELGSIGSVTPDDWTPRPVAAANFLAGVARSGTICAVTDIFDIQLGIRTGDNGIFIAPSSFVDQTGKVEREFFRPLADNIRRGRIHDTGFVFYPYANGQLAIATEDELRQLAPSFYVLKLEPSRARLNNRESVRKGQKWWELARPRTTWLTFGKRRIVSTTFGRRGAFALDDKGKYALIQGHVWSWKSEQQIDDEGWFSYIAILNSPAFEAILDYFCPRTQGGQYELANRYLQKVPLPNITALGKRERKQLANFGRSIHVGERVPLFSLDAAVIAAYGVTTRDFLAAFPLTNSSRLEIDFERLASEWKRGIGGLSSSAQQLSHPAMQKILAMDDAAIPLILREIKSRPAWWFGALSRLTGDDPVPSKHKGLLDKSAEAWLAWGKEHGYEI